MGQTAMWAPAIIEKKENIIYSLGQMIFKAMRNMEALVWRFPINLMVLLKIILANHWLINFTMEHNQSINLYLKIPMVNTI